MYLNFILFFSVVISLFVVVQFRKQTISLLASNIPITKKYLMFFDIRRKLNECIFFSPSSITILSDLVDKNVMNGS